MNRNTVLLSDVDSTLIPLWSFLTLLLKPGLSGGHVVSQRLDFPKYKTHCECVASAFPIATVDESAREEFYNELVYNQYSAVIWNTLSSYRNKRGNA